MEINDSLKLQNQFYTGPPNDPKTLEAWDDKKANLKRNGDSPNEVDELK